VVGLAHHLRMDSWIEGGRLDPDCLEVDAEPFYKTTWHRLHWLAATCPLIVKCSSLSLGGPDPIDERQLASCAAIARAANARWVSHALGFSRAGEIDLGLIVPTTFTRSTLSLVGDRVREVMERCGCPLAIANVASPLRIHGTIGETDFLNELCRQSGCKLVVDLSALDAARVRHRVDVATWLDAIDAQAVVQMRITIAAWRRDREAWPSFLGQLTHAARLLQRRPDAVIVLAASPACPMECLDRAWSALGALAGKDRADTADGAS
jgi:uncharacterized protein (UPF0276 family)